MALRYKSLDVFRGATVCFMILVNNPGSWEHIYAPLKHANWHGLTPTDLVFPFFLFAVGNAMAFVMPKLLAAGDKVFWAKILKRSILIFFIGLFLNWYPFLRWQQGTLELVQWVNPHDSTKGVRILGVLQRIAICYFFASIILYYLKPRQAYFLSLLLLLLYWVICIVGNSADPYSIEGWYGNVIDKAVLHVQHMYKGEGFPFEPEGILSTLPAIVQVVFGYFVSKYIMDNNKSDVTMPNTNHSLIYKTLTRLFVVGCVMIFTGFCWDMVLPINKKIWTSSYVVYTTGLAMIILCTMIYVIEVRGVNNFFTRFFEVFGKNALFIFALSALLPKTASLFTNAQGVNFWNILYKKLFILTPGQPQNGSLLYAVSIIIFMWAICYWLDKKKIYIKV